MSAIFISHSSHDSDIARSIERMLARHAHHSVFLDLDPEKGIVGGQSWERTLYRKLRACRAVIVLVTDHYLASQWCFAELALARMEGKHVLALRADPLDAHAVLPAILLQEQLIDWRADATEGPRRLLRALAALDLPAAAGDWNPTQPPYPGLSAYQEADAPVFFGREADATAGVELLERGAPNLVMVLGASGSGKSSLALAGILPRLRTRDSRWVVADPFRPGRDPMSELVESLARLQARLSADAGEVAPGLAHLRARLWQRLDDTTPDDEPVAESSATGAAQADEPGRVPPAEVDVRLQRLLSLLGQLQADPPPRFGSRTREHLTWTLDDLRRLLEVPVSSPASTGEHGVGPSLAAVAGDIVRLSPRRDARLLLVIDQFEELLGAAPEEAAGRSASRFLRVLRDALDAEHSALTVLATMRSDFLGLFQRHASLQEVDFESLSLGPMGIEGMRRVIESPARLAAIEIEPGLVERLLADTATPDALPLLSFTLSVLYRDRSDSGRITLADYSRAGGLQGTIGREADAVLAAADRGRQEDALRLALLRMARLGEGGGHARVAVPWSLPEIARARPLLEQLVERRVLVSRAEGDVPVVEVAHEALFRTWAPLRAWLEDARADLLLREQIERDAAAWQAAGRSADALWRGGRLVQAEEWLQQADDGGSAGLAGEFVRAGLHRRRRTRVLMGSVTLGVVAVLTTALAYSLQQTGVAREQRARALDLARVSIAGESMAADPTTAALTLTEVGDPEGTRFGPRRLGQALAAPLVEAEFRASGPVHSVDIDAAGKRVLTTSGKTVAVWAAGNGQQKLTFSHDEGVTLARFDPTGQFVLVRAGRMGHGSQGVGFFEDQAGQRAWIHESQTGKPLFTIERSAPIELLLFSPDGRWLLVGAGKQPAQLWDLRDRKARLLDLPMPEEKLAGAAFSRDGLALVLAAGERSRRWALPEGVPAGPVLEHGQRLEAVAFSPDGKRIAFGGSAGVQVREAADLWEVGALPRSGEPLWVRRLSFSPDGDRLLAADALGKVQILSGHDGEARRFSEPIVHGGLQAAFFSADGQRVLTLPGHPSRRGYGQPDHDNSLRIWDAESGKALGQVLLAALPDELMEAAFDSGAQRLVANVARRTGGGRGQTLEQQPVVRLWRAEHRDRRILAALPHAAEVRTLAFDPQGRRFLTAAGHLVRVWVPGSDKPVHELRHDKDVTAASFSADGQSIVSASDDGLARLWDANSGQQRLVARHEQGVRAAALLGGDKLLATVSGKRLRLWTVKAGDGGPAAMLGESRQVPERLNQTLDTDMISPDGRLIAVLESNSVQVWDVALPAAEKPRYTLPHGGWARRAVFIDGGQALVTGADDDRVRVWDMATGKERQALDVGSKLAAMAVSPDGESVLSHGEDGRVRLWCSRTGRMLHEGSHGCGPQDAWFVAEGRRAATRSRGEFNGCGPSLRVWDVTSGRLISSMPSSERVLFSADGRRMLGPGAREFNAFQGMNPKGDQIWDVDSAEMRFSAPLQLGDRPGAAALSPDGMLLLAAAGQEATLWAVGGRELQRLLGTATTVCLAVDFRRLYLGEADDEARQRHADCERRQGRG